MREEKEKEKEKENGGDWRSNIWITCKTRMQAEKRLKFYSLFSLLALNYFSFIIVVSAIFSGVLSERVPFFNEINISMSVALLASSLLFQGFKFDDVARLHRECYLRLQKLLEAPGERTEILGQYYEVLAEYPNHAPRDYDDLVIDRTLFRDKPIWDQSGPVRWTGFMVAKKLFRMTLFYLMLLAVLSLGVYLIVYPLVSSRI